MWKNDWTLECWIYNLKVNLNLYSRDQLRYFSLLWETKLQSMFIYFIFNVIYHGKKLYEQSLEDKHKHSKLFSEIKSYFLMSHSIIPALRSILNSCWDLLKGRSLINCQYLTHTQRSQIVFRMSNNVLIFGYYDNILRSNHNIWYAGILFLQYIIIWDAYNNILKITS